MDREPEFNLDPAIAVKEEAQEESVGESFEWCGVKEESGDDWVRDNVCVSPMQPKEEITIEEHNVSVLDGEDITPSSHHHEDNESMLAEFEQEKFGLRTIAPADEYMPGSRYLRWRNVKEKKTLKQCTNTGNYLAINPSLEHCKKMRFLNVDLQLQKCTRNCVAQNDINLEMETEPPPNSPILSSLAIPSGPSIPVLPYPIPTTTFSVVSRLRRKRSRKDILKRVLLTQLVLMGKVLTQVLNKDETEDELFGNVIAAELRKITDERKKMKMKVAIFKLFAESVE